MIVDPEHLQSTLERCRLSAWLPSVEALAAERLAPGAHGDLPAWLAAIEALPEIAATKVCMDQPTVSADLPAGHAASQIASLLKQLAPWRKGPFRIGEVHIDSEWRSDWKWQRLESSITSLDGRRVLDVGCGNGYYAWRMLGAGADTVIGVDPTILFLAQFRALSTYLPGERILLLPLRLEELPNASAGFDTAFSMGVLYHQRSPIEHLRQLRAQLRAGGELVLETLVLPGDEAFSRTPEDRYARMRNVWMLPSLPELETWLSRSGFRDIRTASVEATSTEEQRSTDWMPFESLAEALDPADPSRTVEGWPAPCRAVVIASRPT